MKSRRKRTTVWKHIAILFLVYSAIVFCLFLLVDKETILDNARNNLSLFALKIFGTGFIMAFSYGMWSKKDPDLKKW